MAVSICAKACRLRTSRAANAPPAAGNWSCHYRPSRSPLGNRNTATIHARSAPANCAAMKAGASDFIEKPISRAELLACVDRALEQSRDTGKLLAWREDAASHIAGLTPRQRQVMGMVLAGHPSKNIAADLGISQRTVENHRASIMTKTGTRSLPALARLALAAAINDRHEVSRPFPGTS